MVGQPEDSGPRPSLREESRRSTVRRLVTSASALFLEQGYASTTIDAIAERAGTGRRTVFTAVGGKAALLKLAYDWALVGDDEPVPMAQRPAIIELAAEQDPSRAIRLWTELQVLVASRSAPLALVLVLAADSDPDAATLLATSRANARYGASMFVEHLARIGGLKPQISRGRATDITLSLMQPELYVGLLDAGWDSALMVRWFSDMLAGSLLISDTGPITESRRSDATSEPSDDSAGRTKLVVAVRSDLNMSIGKVAAQVSHGAV